MGFKDNDEEVDDQKVILHDNRWDFYTKKKNSLLRVGILCKCHVLTGIRFFWKW